MYFRFDVRTRYIALAQRKGGCFESPIFTHLTDMLPVVQVGERRVVYAYVLLAIGLEMTVWLLPNLFGNAIAFALVGVLMGEYR
jgi:hypothetical protein